MSIYGLEILYATALFERTLCFLLNVFNFKDKNNATFPEAVLLDFRAGYNRIGGTFKIVCLERS